jgi:hypothetical protein
LALVFIKDMDFGNTVSGGQGCPLTIKDLNPEEGDKIVERISIQRRM